MAGLEERVEPAPEDTPGRAATSGPTVTAPTPLASGISVETPQRGGVRARRRRRRRRPRQQRRP
eukprot:11454651-Alexandrium_andersonii.AAC.1